MVRTTAVILLLTATADRVSAQPNCNALYPNGNRPAIANPVHAVYQNQQVLCNGNTYGVANFPNDYFEINYNVGTLNPNYVAYCLDPARMNNITTGWWINAGLACCSLDPRVEAASQPSRKFGYTNMKLDIGHMFPQGASGIALDAMGYANFTTNTSPQLALMNRGRWKVMENYIRTLALTGSVYVLVAPRFAAMPANPPGTRLAPGWPTRANPGPNGVALPDSFFAIIYQPIQTNVANQTLLAYVFPNRATAFNNVVNNFVMPFPAPPGLPILAPFYVTPANIPGTIVNSWTFTINNLLALVNAMPLPTAANNTCGTAIN
jgi:DNA/RNA endonuclease G (NUC1)